MNSYFYLDANNQQAGPAPADQLVALGVNANTLVWCQGMSSWMKAGQVAELGGLFMPQPAVAPPLPPQSEPQPAYQQPEPQPAYQQPEPQPAYQQPEPQPAYQQPEPQPAYQQPEPQPAYQQPEPQPAYQQPQQPAYQQPAYQQPAYQQPAYQQPAYQQQPGGYPPAGGGDVPACPPNYLAWSIVITILCCWPFGIPAIVNAAKVNSYYVRGQIDEAYAASASAKKWCIVSAIVGVVFWVLYAIYVVVVINNL